jgi:hypothetical protein
VSETPRERQIREALERAEQSPGIPQPVAGHPGLAAVNVPVAGTTTNTLRVGERVRKKNLPAGVDPALWTGTVASVPKPGAPLVRLGSHVLGNEVGVDLDGGGRGVADHDEWERIG